MAKKKKKKQQRPPATAIIIESESDPPGCLYLIGMLALGVWIAFVPIPYFLALGTAILLPPLAFLVWRVEKHRLEYAHLFPTWQSLSCQTSSLLVIALAYRWWDEYDLVVPLYWAVASQLIAMALLVPAHFYRPAGEMLPHRAVVFSLYVGSLLGLANTHLDQSPPAYVQGIVIDESYRDGIFRNSPRYYIVAPYLHWDAQLVARPRDRRQRVERGTPMCSVSYAGGLGLARHTHHVGLCPTPDAAARVRALQQNLMRQ